VTRSEALATLLLVLLLMVGAGAVGFVVGNREPPPVAPAQAHVVRMLDIVIRDSNTTNRRQRFECRPTDAPTTTTKEPK
jgi:hypothetical protein